MKLGCAPPDSTQCLPDHLGQVEGLNIRRHRHVSRQLDQITDESRQLFDLASHICHELSPRIRRQRITSFSLYEEVKVGAQ